MLSGFPIQKKVADLRGNLRNGHFVGCFNSCKQVREVMLFEPFLQFALGLTGAK